MLAGLRPGLSRRNWLRPRPTCLGYVPPCLVLVNRCTISLPTHTRTHAPHSAVDSMAAQYGFLKLGPYGLLHTHMPAALTPCSRCLTVLP